jgi:hypothetical protein
VDDGVGNQSQWKDFEGCSLCVYIRSPAGHMSENARCMLGAAEKCCEFRVYRHKQTM